MGAANEEVTVEGSAIQVETSTGAVGNVISGVEVRELPLNGNNFMELTQLVPGVSSLSDFNTVKKGLEGNTDFSVNGNLTTANLFMVDGVNNNDIGSNRTILIYPSIQAIDEFKILRNSYGAEYGQAAGAIINIVTRSGTNSWHGGAAYYGRNTALNSTDYFTHQFEQTNPLIKKAPLHRNDALFNISGPIIKDKLFFFESEEWDREIRGATYAALVPTLAERGGDFSAPYPGAGAAAGGGNCSGGSVSSTYSSSGGSAPPFTGNVIPAANLSPFGLNYMGNFPLPNLSSIVNCANWAANVSTPVRWREDHVRGDWNITPTLKLFARYTRDTWENPFPSTLQYWGEDIYPNVGDAWGQPSSQATLKLTKLIGPTAVNDFQVSFAANAINVTRGGQGVGGNYYTSPGVLAPSLSANSYVLSVNQLSLPYFPLSGKAFPLSSSATSLGQPGFWSNGPTGINCKVGTCGTIAQQGPWHNNEQLLILKDDFSKVVGSHTFRAGFIATNNQKDQRQQNEGLGENAQYWSTTADGWGGPASSGNGVFDMLNKGTQWGFGESSTNVYEYTRWHDYEFYGADNWKIRRNVTLDLGVRWSFIRNGYMGNGRYGYWEPSLFNPTLTFNGSPQVNSPCNGMLTTRVGVAACAAVGLAGGTVGTNTGLVPNNNHLIQPRIGIAWDVRGDGKTAIRAGFGTFYDRFMLNTVFGSAGNPPFAFGVASSVGGQRPFDNPGPSCPALNASCVLGTAPASGLALNDHVPEAIQYNLTIEHELFRNTKLEVAYVGNQGRFLETFTNANSPTTLATRIAYAESSFGGNANNTLTPFGALTKWGQIGFASFNGVSHYDSLQALFKTRLKVVDAQFAYTYGKSLANTDISDSSGSPQNNNMLLANDPRYSYGPSILNRPHILAGSLVYNAPALTGQNSFIRAALGSWETSAILQYTSGASITVFSGEGNDIVGSAEVQALRPNLVAGQSCKPSSASENQFLNPSMFTLDHYQIGAIPTAGRGVCLGPGLANTDFSIRKNFKITERVTAKFSMDFFNLFNKTQFLPSSVSTNLSNSSVSLCNGTSGFGTSKVCPGYGNDQVQWNRSTQLNTSLGQASGDRTPRQVQYGLKVEF
jgi:TonB-dependent receptor-like protein